MDLRTQFDEHIAGLFADLHTMCALAKHQLRAACELLIHPDLDKVSHLVDEDKKIDQLEMSIDDQCVRLIATEQPVATDLRKLISLTKITALLELVGDLARYIARKSRKDIPDNFKAHVPKLIDICNFGIDMLTRSITAFENNDTQAARDIAAEDDRIDSEHKTMRHAIIHDMKQDPEYFKKGNILLEINRLVELLGDYVATICEWTIFAVEGTHPDLN